jgi:hypothetical protein
VHAERAWITFQRIGASARDADAGVRARQRWEVRKHSTVGVEQRDWLA